MQIKNHMSSSFFIETTEKHTFYVEKHLKKRTSNRFKCYFYTIDKNIFLRGKYHPCSIERLCFQASPATGADFIRLEPC